MFLGTLFLENQPSSNENPLRDSKILDIFFIMSIFLYFMFCPIKKILDLSNWIYGQKDVDKEKVGQFEKSMDFHENLWFLNRADSYISLKIVYKNHHQDWN